MTKAPFIQCGPQSSLRNILISPVIKCLREREREREKATDQLTNIALLAVYIGEGWWHFKTNEPTHQPFIDNNMIQSHSNAFAPNPHYNVNTHKKHVCFVTHNYMEMTSTQTNLPWVPVTSSNTWHLVTASWAFSIHLTPCHSNG